MVMVEEFSYSQPEEAMTKLLGGHSHAAGIKGKQEHKCATNE